MFNKITNLITKRPIQILVVSFIIFAVLLAGVVRVELKTGNETLIETDTQDYIDNYNYQEEFGSDPIIVIYEGTSVEDLLTIEKMNNMNELETRLFTYDDIFTINSPVAIVNQFGGVPPQQEMLDAMIYDEFGNLKSMFSEFIIDDQYMMFIVVLEGETPDDIKNDIVITITDYLEEEGLTESTLVSGKPVLDLAIKSSMTESMQQMLMLSAIIMIIILFIVFRVRWSLLPLAIILIATITTIGIMGWLNIGLTMVSMAVFPILIGLGIDYAIQFQSRYTEELAGGTDNE